MGRPRVIHWLFCFILLTGLFGGLVGDRVMTVAAQEEIPEEGNLDIETKYPVVSDVSGAIFNFEIELKYQGSERKRFDITTTEPLGWRALVVAGAPEQQVIAVEIGPSEGFAKTERIKVRFGPLFGETPEPGDYVVMLEVDSGDIKETLELKAVVTAKYEFSMQTATGRLNTEADAGEDNHLTVKLVNSGSAAIEDITFTSSKPEDWSITFTPERIDALESGLTQEVDVVIKPPRRTITGDYMATIKAESKEASDDLELRVTVLTPTIWGWVGILIVVVVIGGLGVIFWRLGRR